MTEPGSWWAWIPLVPFVGALVLALLPGWSRIAVAAFSTVLMGVVVLLSGGAFLATLEGFGQGGSRWTEVWEWMRIGDETVRLGWMLDPLAATMLLVVSIVSLLVFLFSAGYMAEDPGFQRFYASLNLFAGAMLGLVLSNHLLLLFVFWEMVGVASFLLIGFWNRKPAAVAAARKAFLTTRLADVALLFGLLWLWNASGTLLFYDEGAGVLEDGALEALGAGSAWGGWSLSGAIALLLFIGAMGKSGQFPLHVWLPDAMEGPTPVSALIHAATMVAAGVFLMARVHPLLEAGDGRVLGVMAWIGAVTAVFAALVAVAQTDVKRILAYSTVSQLGYMMTGIAVGGVAVGMFHLVTHAFFKALLFLGAGSLIHACHHEQDIRRLGGLRSALPLTFAVYAIGTLALCGVPFLFSGFWSKDAILHAAGHWPGGAGPFALLLGGVFLTAFYMTRQVRLVFFGRTRLGVGTEAAGRREAPHEGGWAMRLPLLVLAVPAVGAGFVGTPLWPGFQAYLAGDPVAFDAGALAHGEFWGVVLIGALLTGGGMVLAWRWYTPNPRRLEAPVDPVAVWWPSGWRVLERRFLVDEFYRLTVLWWLDGLARLARALDRGVVEPLVNRGVGAVVRVTAWVARVLEEWGLNAGFTLVCDRLGRAGGRLVRMPTGSLTGSLRALAVAVIVVLILMSWGGVR